MLITNNSEYVNRGYSSCKALEEKYNDPATDQFSIYISSGATHSTKHSAVRVLICAVSFSDAKLFECMIYEGGENDEYNEFKSLITRYSNEKDNFLKKSILNVVVNRIFEFAFRYAENGANIVISIAGHAYKSGEKNGKNKLQQSMKMLLGIY